MKELQTTKVFRNLIGFLVPVCKAEVINTSNSKHLFIQTYTHIYFIFSFYILYVYILYIWYISYKEKETRNFTTWGIGDITGIVGRKGNVEVSNGLLIFL